MCMGRLDVIGKTFMGTVVLVVTGITLLVLFDIFVLQPRDQVGFEIMHCMEEGEDRSRESFEACRVQVLERRAR